MSRTIRVRYRDGQAVIPWQYRPMVRVRDVLIHAAKAVKFDRRLRGQARKARLAAVALRETILARKEMR